MMEAAGRPVGASNPRFDAILSDRAQAVIGMVVASAGAGPLRWSEKAKLKADMTNAREAWLRVDPDLFASRACHMGLASSDVADIAEWLRRAQAGRTLVPIGAYSNFVFVDATIPDLGDPRAEIEPSRGPSPIPAVGD